MPDPTHQTGIAGIAGSLAAKFLERHLTQGGSLEIPSLGIHLAGPPPAESNSDSDEPFICPACGVAPVGWLPVKTAQPNRRHGYRLDEIAGKAGVEVRFVIGEVICEVC